MRSYPEIDPRAVWGVILTRYREQNPIVMVNEPEKVETRYTSDRLHYGEAAMLTHAGHDIGTGWDEEAYFITPSDASRSTVLTEGEAESLLYEMSNSGILDMHKHGDENDGTPLFLPAPVEVSDILYALDQLARRMEESR